MQKGALNVDRIRKDFPILCRKIKGRPLVYFDNAATTQKPLSVIDAIRDYYMNYNSNIHRAVHQMAEEATQAYETTRQKVATLINSPSTDEIIFTRNATEAINLVSHTWGHSNIHKKDRILITELEHHSNIVPWQILCKQTQASLDYVDVDRGGYLNMDQCEKVLHNKNTKLISISEVSNVLGTIVPIKQIIKMAHDQNIPVLVDAAQSVPHMPVDVQASDCDFMVFSAHKMLGPTGVGILYVKKDILEKLEPFISGGDMIKEVHKYDTIYNDLPYKFEAGTPNIADVIGFSAAIDYLSRLGMDNIRDHEIELTRYAMDAMKDIKGITLYGPLDTKNKGGVISFNLGDIHPHDLATILDDHGIAIRSGHHCAQVLMEKFDLSATSRASFYIYNTVEEVDIFLNALDDARRLFRI
ncbi:MAG TPA: cysteine desulfurase [Nitrososphaeraceae archaeon]|jgi:cysteine desulfurase/selenocysteine lyase